MAIGQASRTVAIPQDPRPGDEFAKVESAGPLLDGREARADFGLRPNRKNHGLAGLLGLQ